MKKKRIILIITILIILFILTGIILYFYSNNNKIKLKKLGYSNLETIEILKLTDEEVNNILKYDYNNNLIYIIESSNYDKNKLPLYLKYINEYNNIDYLKIFNLINNNNTDTNQLDKYLELLHDYNNVDGIIAYVNNYSHLNLEVNDTILAFMNQKYFIIDYLDRYLKHYENNKDLEYNEIISRINSNLDYNFYEDSNPADLSKGMYTLINKFYYLDSNYVPDNLITVDYEYAINNTKLNKIALDNFIEMSKSAREKNLIIKITTAYRDYNFQSLLYNNYVKNDGIDNADTYSARPGYSEHQFGYSVDLTTKNYSEFDEFEHTDEYIWLKDNAHKYGFILRYPKDKEYITGYKFESWHYRYVGIDIATYIYENNITYEEYYAYFLR